MACKNGETNTYDAMPSQTWILNQKQVRNKSNKA